MAHIRACIGAVALALAGVLSGRVDLVVLAAPFAARDHLPADRDRESARLRVAAGLVDRIGDGGAVGELAGLAVELDLHTPTSAPDRVAARRSAVSGAISTPFR